MKTVFTTGEAAKICKVSQQTIIRCFDSGQLKGFRVPGSRFRRIPREALYRFMKENSLPTDALESGRRRILIVDDDQAVVDLITDVLAADNRFETKVVNNGFGAGMIAKEYHPDLIILDVMLPDINGKAVCELIRSDATMSDIKIICISGMVEEDRIQELRDAGADDFMHKPLDIDELARCAGPTRRCPTSRSSASRAWSRRTGSRSCGTPGPTTSCTSRWTSTSW